MRKREAPFLRLELPLPLLELPLLKELPLLEESLEDPSSASKQASIQAGRHSR
jgi:hypothetical protein